MQTDLGRVWELREPSVAEKPRSAKAAEAEAGQRPVPPRATPAQRGFPATRTEQGPGGVGREGQGLKAQLPRPRLAHSLLRSQRWALAIPRHALSSSFFPPARFSYSLPTTRYSLLPPLL